MFPFSVSLIINDIIQYQAGNDLFSTEDRRTFWIEYLVTPSGTLRKYDRKNPTEQYDKGIEIYNDLPYDNAHPQKVVK